MNSFFVQTYLQRSCNNLISSGLWVWVKDFLLTNQQPVTAADPVREEGSVKNNFQGKLPASRSSSVPVKWAFYIVMSRAQLWALKVLGFLMLSQATPLHSIMKILKKAKLSYFEKKLILNAEDTKRVVLNHPGRLRVWIPWSPFWISYWVKENCNMKHCGKGLDLPYIAILANTSRTIITNSGQKVVVQKERLFPS